MFSLAHRTVLLTPTEDAFDHCAARLRYSIAFVPRGASVDGALAASTGFGNAIVLRHMRCDVPGAKIGHMIGRVVGLLSSPAVMRRPVALLLALSMISEARRSAVPLACVTIPATASPCRFSMVAWPI